MTDTPSTLRIRESGNRGGRVGAILVSLGMFALAVWFQDLGMPLRLLLAVSAVWGGIAALLVRPRWLGVSLDRDGVVVTTSFQPRIVRIPLAEVREFVVRRGFCERTLTVVATDHRTVRTGISFSYPWWFQSRDMPEEAALTLTWHLRRLQTELQRHSPDG